MSTQRLSLRYCDVMAALDARRTARTLRRMGHPMHAAVAWGLVQAHLHRARIAKAVQS